MKMKLPFSECRYCVYDQDILSGMTRNNDYFVAKLYQCLLVTSTSFVIFDSPLLFAVDMRETSKLWLISWLPLNSTPFSKMNYTVRNMISFIYSVAIL